MEQIHISLQYTSLIDNKQASILGNPIRSFWCTIRIIKQASTNMLVPWESHQAYIIHIKTPYTHTQTTKQPTINYPLSSRQCSSIYSETIVHPPLFAIYSHTPLFLHHCSCPPLFKDNRNLLHCSLFIATPIVHAPLCYPLHCSQTMDGYLKRTPLFSFPLFYLPN